MTGSRRTAAPEVAVDEAAAGFRTYEVYQRERVWEPRPPIKPRELYTPQFLDDPYPVLTALREATPCYRDWPGNAFWVTRYDDVTSVFVDEPNYVTRPRAWFAELEGIGQNRRDEIAVRGCVTRIVDAAAAEVAHALCDELAAEQDGAGAADLAIGFAARYPVELWARVLGLPAPSFAWFAERLLRLRRAGSWEPRSREDARTAFHELLAGLQPVVAQRRDAPGDDLISVIAGLGGDERDVVATLLEEDHDTLHGSLANLWFLLLTHRDQLGIVTEERRLVKAAWLEAMRHSTPVLIARRFTRHEVERFGRLLPDGALVVCSAAAANRDRRAFPDPDTFSITRKDLCHREARGHYRADGLCSPVSFGTGAPSKHPALPEDRPRSRFALTRDTAVTASRVLLERLGDVTLAAGATPTLRSLQWGELRTCWSLPVTFTPR